MVSSTRPPGNAPHLIVQLPTELLNTVLSFLPNHDLKSLRLACKSVQATVPLRFGRVFISPHSRDIEVFEAVAKHDTLRHQVTEIVYDDARFMDPFPPTEEEQEVDEHEGRFQWEDEAPPPKGVPHWYNYFYNKVIQKMDGWRAEDVQHSYHQARADKFKARLNVRASYRLYHKLQRQQEKVMRNNADAKALLHHLPCFPQLKRVTLTPAVHGQDLRPLYETPAIRELPYGFIYPPPRGWPMLDPDHGHNPEAEAWDCDSVKNKWRGFRIVTRALASYLKQNPKPSKVIPEFVVDTNYLMTGINCRVFAEPNEEYNDLVTIMQQPGFTRVDLSLLVGGQFWSARHFFHSDALRSAFAKAPDLQHVSLFSNMEEYAFDMRQTQDSELDYWVPLRNLFPIDAWSNLRHFGLVHFLVMQSDLVSFLAAMPPTLRSVELSLLQFLSAEGSYSELLADVRDKLGWRERVPSERPRIILSAETIEGSSLHSIIASLDREVAGFVYGNGENPFHPKMREHVEMGIGIEIDVFEPAHTRPNVGATGHMKLGIVQWDEWILANTTDLDKL